MRSSRLKVEDGDEVVRVAAAERTAAEKRCGDAVDQRNTAEKRVCDLFDRELKAVQVLVAQVGAAFEKLASALGVYEGVKIFQTVSSSSDL